MITIGAPTPTSEPLGLLTDCHRRIETALGWLLQVAHSDDDTSGAQRELLERALRFFREMAPKHTADEEHSLFPRLRAAGAAPPELDGLETEHQEADRWHAELEQLGQAWLAAGSLPPAQRAIFNARVEQLAALYRRHIDIEDRIVFPLAKQRLSAQEQEQVRREMVGRRAIRLAALALALLLGTTTELPAQIKLGTVKVQGSVRTRAENWDWFSNGTGDNAYTFSGNLLRLSFAQDRKAADWQVELATPVLLGLPENAVAAGSAGALGLGANYFTANHQQRNAAMLFLKQANVRLKSLGGDERQSLKLGRFEFNDGTEVTSKDATLAALKRDRIAQRLIGNFGWTHVGRSLDGMHYVANRRVAIHLLAALPTRGVFQVDGWGPLRTGFVYLSANRAQGHSDWRLFGLYYQDNRSILKTDNRALAARRADLEHIRMGTYGGHYLLTKPTKTAGTLDFLLWGAAQNGRWGVLNHLASAIALEAGWQPAVAPRWKPWFRGGYYHGSGDGNATDTRHGTFFQVLPTPRPFARFPFFNLMNNEDVHGSASVRPSKALVLKTEVHALRLASGADQWLSGGGAFQPWSFGYAGRPSSVADGRPRLANLYDVSADWNANPHLTVSAYYGYAQGLRVIQAIYNREPDGHLGYLELTYRF